MAVTHLITADQFIELPQEPGKRYELVRGELIEMPGARYVHGLIIMALVGLLDRFVGEHNRGKVFGDGVGYLIARMPDSVHVPDASFIAAERIPEEGFPSYVLFAPDLAVEVVSPGDRDDAIEEKVRQYLAAGTRLVWVVRPKTRSVSVYARDGRVRQLASADELAGGDVLPGFLAHVDDLFADLR